MDEIELREKILECCSEIIHEIGPGFMESVYEKALRVSFAEQNLKALCHVPIKVEFHGLQLEEYFVNFLVEDKIMIELKTVENLYYEKKSALNYCLKSTGLQSGLQVNFGIPRLEFRIIKNNKEIYGTYNRQRPGQNSPVH